MEDTDRYQPTARFMSLNDAQAAPIATTDGGMLGFHASRRDVWGFSFQLERNDPFSSHLLVSFCQNICGCTAWWTNQALIDRAREEIDRAANGGSALCSLSGGIDSGVCAVLGNLAIGHKLHCIFIDTGLLRKNESEQVMAYYHDNLGTESAAHRRARGVPDCACRRQRPGGKGTHRHRTADVHPEPRGRRN